MVVTFANLASLVPYAQNPRKQSKQAVGVVAASLKKFGWQQPIVVDSKNVIAAGHTRYYTAKQFRRTTAPVVTISNEFTSWNPTLLRAEFDALPPIGDLDLAVFDFAALIPWEPAAAATDPDEVPPVRRTDIAPGDLFALCAHQCRRSAAGRSCGSPQFQAQPVRRRGPV